MGDREHLGGAVGERERREARPLQPATALFSVGDCAYPSVAIAPFLHAGRAYRYGPPVSRSARNLEREHGIRLTPELSLAFGLPDVASIVERNAQLSAAAAKNVAHVSNLPNRRFLPRTLRLSLRLRLVRHVSSTLTRELAPTFRD